MSKQPRIATDPELLKPIIEAVIFASEEPLSPRALIRLLAGDKESEPAPEESSMSLDFSPAEGEREEDGGEREEDGGERIEDGNEGALRGAMLADIPVARPSSEDSGEGLRSATVPVARPASEDEGSRVGDGNDADGVPDAVTDTTIPMELRSEPEDVVEGADADVKGDEGEPGGDAQGGEMEIEGDGADLADAMERMGERVSARQFRPADGTLDQAYLRALIDELNDEYMESCRAFRIVEVAGGFQFATIREYGEFVAMLSKDKARRKLSPAALETLAIIAYRQPVSKPEVEAIRGVNCDQVLLNLMEKNLIAITGRSEAVGRPLLYGTTEDFLRSFGLKGIGDLPKLREIEELMEEDAYSAERAEVITIDENTDVAELEAQIGAAGYAAEEEAEDGGERVEDSGDASDIAEAVPAGTIPLASPSELEDRVSEIDDSEEGVESALRSAMSVPTDTIPVAPPSDLEDDDAMELTPDDEATASVEGPDDAAGATEDSEEDAGDTEEPAAMVEEATEEPVGDEPESEGEIAEDINAG